MRLSIRIEVEKASMKAGRRRRPESQTKFKTKSIAKASRNLKIELRVSSTQLNILRVRGRKRDCQFEPIKILRKNYELFNPSHPEYTSNPCTF